MRKLLDISFALLSVITLFVQVYIYFLSDASNLSGNLFEVAKYSFCLLYLFSLIYVYVAEAKVSGRFNITFLLYLSFGLFLGSNILLDGFDGVVFGSVAYFTNEVFSIRTNIQIVAIISFGLIGMNFGYIFKSFLYQTRIDARKYMLSDTTFKKRDFYAKISLILFVPAFLSTIYKMYLKYTQAVEFGYISLYADREYISAPALVNFLDTFTFALLIIYLIFADKESNKKIVSLIYCAALLLSMLSGARAEALSQMLVILMYFSYIYGATIKIYKVLPFAVLLIVYSQYISADRIGLIDDVKGNPLVNFLVEQGGSYSVVGYAIEYDEQFDDLYKRGVIFSPFVSLVRSLLGVVDEYSELTSAHELLSGYSFAYGLSYAVNPNLYLSGYGLGSSYIAELWIGYGVFGVLIVSAILVIGLSRIQSFSMMSPMYLYIFLNAAEFLLMAPRASLFAFVPYLIRPIIAYMAVYFLYQILVEKRTSWRKT